MCRRINFKDIRIRFLITIAPLYQETLLPLRTMEDLALSSVTISSAKLIDD